MKKFVLILLIFISAHYSFSQTQFIPSYDDFTSEMEYLSSCFPRMEGSKNERKVIEFIKKTLNEEKIPFRVIPFNQSDSFHSFSSCIDVTINGAAKDTLIITAPMNHPLDTRNPAKDGSVNIALGMALLKHFERHKPLMTLKILFMGSEFGKEGITSIGSRIFLEDFFNENAVILLYLSLQNIPEKILIKGASNEIIAPNWLMNRVSASLQASMLNFQILGNENKLYRLGIISEDSLIDPYLRNGFPSAVIEGSGTLSNQTNRTEWFYHFFNFIEQFIKLNHNSIPDEWDRHYLTLQLGDFSFIIDETTYLVLYMSIFVVLFILIILFSRVIKNYTFLVLKNSWSIPVFLIVLFSFLVLSSLSIHAILSLKGNQALWEKYPLIFFLAKSSVTLTLFSLTIFIIRKIPFSRDKNFYYFLSLLLLLMNILVLSAVNISLTFYFLWALLFLLGSRLVKNRILKVLFYLLSPFWLLKIMLEFLITANLDFCRILIISTFWGNFFITLILIPFVLFIRGLMYEFTGQAFLFRKRILLLFTAPLIIMIAGFITVLLLAPEFSSSDPQKITAENVINTDNATNSIFLKSPSALGKLRIQYLDKDYSVYTKSPEFTITNEQLPALLIVETKSTPFLNRKNLTINLYSVGNPYKIHLTLESDEDITLYDANFPFIRKSQGKEYEILIGYNPPKPLSVLLTIPKDMVLKLHTTVEYTQFPFTFNITSPNKKFSASLTLVQTFLVKS
ncbi:MAG: hypothetical protein JW969_02995 [Spirochaetales bacterium]|nr:hypothetical protein [Spirochaetales bacterium]